MTAAPVVPGTYTLRSMLYEDAYLSGGSPVGSDYTPVVGALSPSSYWILNADETPDTNYVTIINAANLENGGCLFLNNYRDNIVLQTNPFTPWFLWTRNTTGQNLAFQIALGGTDKTIGLTPDNSATLDPSGSIEKYADYWVYEKISSNHTLQCKKE